MKPLPFVVVVLGLIGGALFFMSPQRGNTRIPQQILPTKKTKVVKRPQRRKSRRIALRLRRRGQTIRIKQYTSRGPFVFYRPKHKSRQHWKGQARLRYRIRYKAQTALDFSNLPMLKRRVKKSQLKQRNQYTITGDLHLHVKPTVQGAAQVSAQLTDLKLMQQKQVATAPSGMTEVFWFQVGSRGRMTRFRFAQNATERDRRLMTELVKQLEFRLPRQYKGNRWTYQEKDANGVYTEELSWLKRTRYTKRTIDFFMKRKLRYDRIQKKKFLDNIRLSRSVYRVQLGTKQIGIEAIDGGETFAFQRSNGVLWMKASIQIAYQRVRQMDSNLALWSAKQGITRTIRRPKRRTARRRVVTRYRSLNEALRAFATLKNRSKNQAAHAVAHFLKAYPEQNQVLANRIKQGSVPKSQHSLLMHTFELAATPAAQSTLVQIMNDKEHTKINRLRAIVASNSFKSPSKQVVHSLWNLHKKRFKKGATVGDKSRASTALLALGALRKANARHAQVSRQLNQKLRSALQQSRTIPQKRAALLAIKNAASSALAPAVKPYLADPSFMVRQAAAEVFLHMSSTQHNVWLATQLQRESIPTVQTALLRSITESQRVVPMVTQWIQQNLRARERKLRLAMAHYLGKTQKQMPLHKQILTLLLKGESNRLLIRTIYTYLLQK